MSWRSVVGLDGIEFSVFVGVSVIVSMAVGSLTNVPEIGFGVLAFSAVVFAFLRRAALRQLPPEAGHKMDELAAQLQDEQQAASEYFERRIAELEERIDFAERLLAQGQEQRQIES